MTHAERFQRIRDGLLKQELMRKGTISAFKAWVAKATPHWNTLIAEYTAECERHYGLVLCEWLDWLDASRLAWRGEIRWQIPTKGPLTFTPPSTEGRDQAIRAIAQDRAQRAVRLVARAFGDVELVGATPRSAPSFAAPTPKTRGARGRGTGKKSPPPK